MSSVFDQLNLRPQERRVLVIVLFLIFVVLNIYFVRPYFGEWGQVQSRLEQARATLKKYQEETARTPHYEQMEKTLQTSGSDVLSEELQLQRLVQSQATTAGIMVNRYDPRARQNSGRTNQFFEDQVLTIDFSAGGKELVDFLSGLASGNSMIRIREMNIKPDSSQTKLAGNLVFVASYQKKAAVAKPVSAPKATTAAKPAAPKAAVAKPPATTNSPAAKEAAPKAATAAKTPATTNAPAATAAKKE